MIRNNVKNEAIAAKLESLAKSLFQKATFEPRETNLYSHKLKLGYPYEVKTIKFDQTKL